jgi:hypothetical protein
VIPTLLAATTTEVTVALATTTSPATDFSAASTTSVPAAHATVTLTAVTPHLELYAHVMTASKATDIHVLI